MSIIKDDSIFAFVEESTEGTAAYPSSATDGYVALRVDGTSMEDQRDTKDRNIFTGTLSAASPRMGIKGVTGTASCEMKGNGTNGNAPDYGILMESILPDVNTISSTTTTKSSGNTGSVLAIEDADISKFTAGDFVVVRQSGAYHPAFITAVDSTGGAANITITPSKASGSFSNSVVIAKSVTYRPADTGHKSFTAAYYWGSGGDGVRHTGLGCRTTSLSMESFTTGELPVFNFSFEGLNFSHTASTNAGYTPTFDTALPSVVLNSKIYKDGSEIAVNDVSLSLEQPIKFLMSTGASNGKTAGRAAGKRNVSGSINPYVDATSVATFTNWEAGTAFALVGYTANPDSTNGIAEGSIVAFYAPNCVITKPTYADQDGVMIEQIEFKATGGANGGNNEIYFGFA